MIRSRYSQWACSLIAVLGMLAGCKPGDNTNTATSTTTTSSKSSSSKPVVYTTFHPTTYFAERIAGDLAKVVNPCPADADPAFWMPDDATLAKYQAANLIILNGAGFESWVKQATLPEQRVVKTAEGFADEFITIKDTVVHSHGPSGKHTHAGVDGHTWLDPLNAKRQAAAIRDALARDWPEHAKTFKKNYDALAEDLDTLDARLQTVKAKLGEQTLLCAHPAYNYLARRYDWPVASLHLDPEEALDADALEEITQAKAEHANAKLMLWEGEPLDETKSTLREKLGLESVVFAPGEGLDEAQRRTGANYLSIMNANANRLLEALGTE
jgi:zinc transport system substrate-binding protein